MSKEETASKQYTAQELRASADECWCVDPNTFSYTKIYRMLRQAADAEEELASVKARLEAVMKEFTQFKQDVDDRLTEAYVFAHEITANSSFDKIYGGVRDAVNGIRKELGIDSAASGEEDNTGKEPR